MHIRFGKREAQLLKGVAILMMLFHHLLGFPKWVAPDNRFVALSVAEGVLVRRIALYCKICVGLYIFTTGYGLALGDVSLKASLKRAHGLLSRYWFAFALFIAVGVVVGEPLPPLRRLLVQAFGLCTATGFGWKYHVTIHPIFAWYVSVYLLFVLTLPLLRRLVGRGFWVDLVVVYGAIYLFCHVMLSAGEASEMLPEAIATLVRLYSFYAPVGMTGFLMSRYGILDSSGPLTRLEGLRRWQVVVLGAVLLYLDYVLRNALSREYGLYLRVHELVSLEMVCVVIFVVGFIMLCAWKVPAVLERVLMAFSKHSTGIWFLHALYFTPLLTFQRAAYFPRLPLMIFAVSAVSMLALATAFDWAFDKICSLADQTPQGRHAARPAGR